MAFDWFAIGFLAGVAFCAAGLYVLYRRGLFR
jgi:hypothetical protein